MSATLPLTPPMPSSPHVAAAHVAATHVVRPTSAVGVSAVKMLTHKLITALLEEFNDQDNATVKRLQSAVLTPLFRAIHAQMMPYLLMIGIMMMIMFLATVMTFALSALFYFRGR